MDHLRSKNNFIGNTIGNKVNRSKIVTIHFEDIVNIDTDFPQAKFYFKTDQLTLNLTSTSDLSGNYQGFVVEMSPLIHQLFLQKLIHEKSCDLQRNILFSTLFFM